MNLLCGTCFVISEIEYEWTVAGIIPPCPNCGSDEVGTLGDEIEFLDDQTPTDHGEKVT